MAKNKLTTEQMKILKFLAKVPGATVRLPFALVKKIMAGSHLDESAKYSLYIEVALDQLLHPAKYLKSAVEYFSASAKLPSNPTVESVVKTFIEQSHPSAMLVSNGAEIGIVSQKDYNKMEPKPTFALLRKDMATEIAKYHPMERAMHHGL
jgi:hypothetical protein